MRPHVLLSIALAASIPTNLMPAQDCSEESEYNIFGWAMRYGTYQWFDDPDHESRLDDLTWEIVIQENAPATGTRWFRLEFNIIS